MPRYRYEAVDPAQVPVYGICEANDEESLATQLLQRRLRLVSAAELSLDSLIEAQAKNFPRLGQLRIGDELREAMLTGLPAHVVVRAIAREPLQHPLPGMGPWLQFVTTVVFLVLFLAWQVLDVHDIVIIAAGVVAFVVTPSLWLLALYLYRWRPKKLLRTLAARLEAGQSLSGELSWLVPSELKAVNHSKLSDEKKARVAADLVPTLMGGNVRSQQFVMSLIGPLAMIVTVVLGLYLAALVVLPGFRDIFADFGTELPALTAVVLEIGEVAEVLGVTGWLLSATACGVGLLLLTAALSTGRFHELLSSIPVFGLVFRWTMQARVARMLAATVRSDCEYAEALRISTACSGFRQIAHSGDIAATQMEQGESGGFSSEGLSGLPISLLWTPEAAESDRRALIAENFQSLSEMLDAATVGQGRLLALIFQVGTLFVAGTLIGTTVIALFMPLIKLLNDLS